MSKKKQINWEGIRKEWEKDKLPVSQIGRQFGCSHTAINKRAKKEGWEKGLSKKVQRKIKEKVLLGSDENKNEDEQIESAVQKGVEITEGHLEILEEYKESLKKLFKPIKSQELLKKLEEQIKDLDIKDLKGYIKTIMELSLSVIKFERELRNIEDNDEETRTLTLKLT